MELNKYIFPLRRWWWLLVASTLIAAIFSLLSVLRQPAMYQARTTLMIGMTINDPNPSNNQFLLGQQLAASYADLANREIVFNATKNALGMDQLPDYLAQALPNTQLIEITVNDSKPQRAQTVANELAHQLMLLSPTNAPSEEQGRQEFIHQQLNNLETQIQATESEIEKLQEQLANTFSAQEINDLQDQITSLQSKMDAMENNYGLLLSNTQKGAINTLTVIETAEFPSNPLGSTKGLTILLAAAVGFVLAACTAFLLEYLDDTLKSPDVVMRLFSAPIIGHIFEHAEGIEGNRLYEADSSNQQLTEPFRDLRTAIEFKGMDKRLKTILVTSPDIGDGKTSVAANLALSIAQRDKKVILLDADLRRPKIHKLFNLPNDQGLVDLVHAHGTFNWEIGIKKVKDVSVLTAGDIPADPAALLSSEKMDLFLAELEEFADVVIIDGPPFIVPDAMILASKVDGVLLIVRPGHTRRSLAKASMEDIKLVGARLVGVVLNRIPLRGANYYAGQNHRYGYYDSSYEDEREGKQKKLNLEKLRQTFSPFANKVLEQLRETRAPYANKVTHFIEAVFKLSPK